MIRIEHLPTARRGTITRAFIRCDSCDVMSPRVVCRNGGDQRDLEGAKGAAEGWVERLVRDQLTHTCPVCLRAEAARNAKAQLGLFGGAA